MPSVEELLSQTSEEVEAYADTWIEYCTVDDDTRLVTIPDKYKKLGVESDAKAKRIWFRFPKLVGNNGVDLSAIGVRVNFRNANGDGDIYIVEDLTTDGDYVIFSWELTRKVTAYKGNVSFVVCAVKSAKDGTIKNEWNTTLNKECEVLEGLEVTEQIEQENPDIIEYILAKLDGSISSEEVEQIIEEYMEKNPPSGMTDEERKQLQKNTEDISELSKEKVDNPSTAKVGQTIVVKAVDENGKPIEWECVDMPSGGVTSWNDLEDRPFYEEVGEVEIFPPTELTLPDELESISFPDPSEIGIEYFLYIGDTVIKGTSQYIGMPYMTNGVVFEDGSRSCWGMFEPSETLSSMSGTYTVKVVTTQSLVVPLDSKYLPQSVPSIAEFVEYGNVVCVQQFYGNGLPKSWKTINIKDLVIPFIHYVVEDKMLTVAVENSETIVFENVDITRRFAIKIETGSPIPDNVRIFLYCGDTYDVPSAYIITNKQISNANIIFCNRIYHDTYISEITSQGTLASSIDRESFTTDSIFNITKIVIQDTEGGELFTGRYSLLYF